MSNENESSRSLRKSSCILLMRSGNNFYNHKGGYGPLVYDETSPTLTTYHLETVFIFQKKRKRK